MLPRLRFAAPLLAAAFAQTLLALSNEDLIKLHQAGFDAETIILKMQGEPAEYDLSTDGLIQLKQAGMPDAVVKAALKLDAGEPAAEAGSGRSASEDRPARGGAGLAGKEIPSVMAPPAENAEVGGAYFTRVSFHYERGKHLATNYGRGLVVPVNTEVELLGFDDESFEIRIVDSGLKIKMVNVPEYTGMSARNLPSRYLSERRTALDKLPKEARVAVEAGELRLGMSKELALLARGYPPIHKTPSIEMDRWVYWSSRFVPHTIVFHNGRLSEGRGLR